MADQLADRADVRRRLERIEILADLLRSHESITLNLEELKRRAVEAAFERCERNAERAAAELGIGRATMYRLLKKYRLGDG